MVIIVCSANLLDSGTDLVVSDLMVIVLTDVDEDNIVEFGDINGDCGILMLGAVGGDGDGVIGGRVRCAIGTPRSS